MVSGRVTRWLSVACWLVIRGVGRQRRRPLRIEIARGFGFDRWQSLDCEVCMPCPCMRRRNSRAVARQQAQAEQAALEQSAASSGPPESQLQSGGVVTPASDDSGSGVSDGEATVTG